MEQLRDFAPEEGIYLGDFFYYERVATRRSVPDVFPGPVVRRFGIETDVLHAAMRFRNDLHQLAGLAQPSDKASRDVGFSCPWEA